MRLVALTFNTNSQNFSVFTGLSEQALHHDDLELKAAGVMAEFTNRLLEHNLLIPVNNVHLAASVGEGTHLIITECTQCLYVAPQNATIAISFNNLLLRLYT